MSIKYKNVVKTAILDETALSYQFEDALAEAVLQGSMGNRRDFRAGVEKVVKQFGFVNGWVFASEEDRLKVIVLADNVRPCVTATLTATPDLQEPICTLSIKRTPRPVLHAEVYDTIVHMVYDPFAFRNRPKGSFSKARQGYLKVVKALEEEIRLSPVEITDRESWQEFLVLSEFQEDAFDFEDQFGGVCRVSTSIEINGKKFVIESDYNDI